MTTLYIEPLYIESDDKVIESEVLDAMEILAVVKDAPGGKVVQVWSRDTEVYYGTLPISSKGDGACIALKTAYQRGLDAGIAVGRTQLQRELKGLLGVGQ